MFYIKMIGGHYMRENYFKPVLNLIIVAIRGWNV